MNPARPEANAFAYDVFLSHNRLDKPWVKRLAEFLRGLGLQVFFDEDSIRLGHNFVRELGAALPKSRRVVLVVSRASLQSQWVALESSIAILEDPAGTTGRLIPVLLDAIGPDQLPPEIRIRQAVALHDPNTRDAALRRLLGELGAQLQDGLALPAWPTETLEVAGFAEAQAWGWDGERLARALIDLDTEVYQGALVQPADKARTWAPLFWDHPQTWRVVVDAPQSVVAYWHFVPLAEEVFERASAAQLTYDQISAAKGVLAFPGEYDLYFSGVCIRARYRTSTVFRLLFGSLLAVLEELAADEMLIRRIAANAYTEAGESLCRTLRMREGPPHPKRGRLFQEDFKTLLKRRSLKARPELLAAYGAD